MVCEFGMSDRLGLVTLHRKGDGDGTFFSELTAADVDSEVKALTDAAYKHAYDTLKAQRTILVRIAEHLQVVETIDGDELDRLLTEELAPAVPVGRTKKEAAGAARIAAAAGPGWEQEDQQPAVSEDEPPVAAS